jgi:hypothetical protein
MLVGGLLRLSLAQDESGEDAVDLVFALFVGRAEISVAAMEAFQHLKRSTMF